MKYRNWGVAVLVCILSFVALFAYKKSETNTSLITDYTLSSTRGVCYTVRELNVQKFVYTYGDQSITTERQDDGHFILPDYKNYPADERYVYELLGQFASPVYNEVVRVAPSDLSTYGITNESPIVTLTDTEGRDYTLMKGYEDYVYYPSADAVYTMNSRPFDLLTFSYESWLSKELISFNMSDVQSIDLRYKTLHTTLMPVKQQETFYFTNDILGDSVATDFANFLETTEVERFIAENANANVLSAYGFDHPNLECTIYFNHHTPITLTIGTIETNENRCYAILNHSNRIVAIPFFEFFSRSLYAALDSAESGTLFDYTI